MLRAAGLFLASLVPLLPFWLDARIRTWEAEAEDGSAAG
jgi:hypothetical protein